MWYDNRLYRLLVVVATYLLAALGASIVQVRQEQFRAAKPPTVDLLALLGTWALAIPLLPLGSLYYVWGNWGYALGGLAFVVLCGLLLWILITSSRVGLILGYGAFIVIILVLARGCGYMEFRNFSP